MHDRDRVVVRLGWSGMTLAIDDPPWRRSCRRDAAAGGLRDVQSDSRDVRLERDRAGRFEEPGMCSVGSGMVLAIGDLAGATFVTLLAATATQFARVHIVHRGVPRRPTSCC